MLEPALHRVASLSAAACLFAGCSDFECVAGDTKVNELPRIEFRYDAQDVRYTYWFEDGAQRFTFDREEVPEPARAAVLVHLAGKTPGDMHGAIGWFADVRPPESTTARIRPMAAARTDAYAAWSGDWTARWLATRAGLQTDAMAIRRELEANLRAAENAGGDPPAPSGTAADTEAKGETADTAPNPPAEPSPTEPAEEPKSPDTTEDPVARALPDAIRKQLSDEGISLGNVKRDRALRVVAARQPLPRDFGLSVEVHPVWLFVEKGCDACDHATRWLEANDVPHHLMPTADPTNARTLRQLSGDANVPPVVPTAWVDGRLLRGFADGAWTDALKQRTKQ